MLPQNNNTQTTHCENNDYFTTINRFEDSNLKETLLRGIYSYGWENPSQIQRQGIPAILTERDVVMQAQSGLGKTGTFSISLLQRIDENSPEIQGVIILPTRELADQVHKVIGCLAENMKINFIKCVGKLQVSNRLTYPNKATILVGTPGKICAVLSRQLIKSQPFNLQLLIIDEFDKTLEEDFIPTIREIFSYMGKSTQIVLSSATVNEDVLIISEKFMRDPIKISIKEEEITLEGIQQFYVNCGKEEWKFETIIDLYKVLIVAQSIIFVNSKRKCEMLESMFKEKDFTVEVIHGGMEQSERDTIMQNFRSGNIKILLSTDLTARGIDVPGVSLVINYDLPNDKAQYIHRIGRTGRYGKKGSAINLIAGQHEESLLKGIENFYSTAIRVLPDNFSELMA